MLFNLNHFLLFLFNMIFLITDYGYTWPSLRLQSNVQSAEMDKLWHLKNLLDP